MEINANDLARAKDLINSESLTSTIQRLLLIDNWSPRHIPETIQQYRNFLFLKKKYGRQYLLPPSVDIDDVWHAHVLHTKEYSYFCEKVFGYYLHHDPHTEGDFVESKLKMQKLFEEETQALYFKEFGDYIYTVRYPALHKKLAGMVKGFVSNLTNQRKKKEEFLYRYQRDLCFKI